MRLLLQPPEAPAQCFWLTRHQWLAWLHMLRALPRSLQEQPSPRDARRHKAPKRGAPLIAAGDLEPETLKAIRLRRLREKVTTVLITDKGQTSTLTLAPNGVQQLQELLEQQAERAGWDAGAALARLSAAAVAAAALGKARKLH